MTSCSSDGVTASPNIATRLLRAAGLWKLPEIRGIHNIVVRAPDGQNQAFT